MLLAFLGGQLKDWIDSYGQEAIFVLVALETIRTLPICSISPCSTSSTSGSATPSASRRPLEPGRA
jgi:hypothetical protein